MIAVAMVPVLNCEGKLVSRRSLVHGGACETWGNTTRQIAVSIIFSIAAFASTSLYNTVSKFKMTSEGMQIAHE